ncbi:DUF7832 domain-containing protein [Neogemmobacter tilapiae]|uniref:DUF7832 domain-containing protein n=1 Tax=Neogemmobacter tilapiae TaxID=875041 RepID=A0A918TWE8_9RHOB|nr:hypothetical protein [Gemmobacter tilapiae]GHC64183.1 hypothetical protein GCM10007315_30660 [Gemmobacter tilapiae]
MKYDDASWHYGGQFPKESPIEYGGTHIALFMKWCFAKGWAGEFHLAEQPEDVQRVNQGEMSATEFLFKHCDGKFGDEDLNEEGNHFASEYYTDHYLQDYSNFAAGMAYTRPEADHDFAKLTAMIDQKFAAFARQNGNSSKPFWKFW